MELSGKWELHFDPHWGAPEMVETNELKVEVVNMWPNRLIGDSQLPENQRLTRTNVNKFNGPDAEKYLRESGLLGPVKIKMINRQIRD